MEILMATDDLARRAHPFSVGRSHPLRPCQFHLPHRDNSLPRSLATPVLLQRLRSALGWSKDVGQILHHIQEAAPDLLPHRLANARLLRRACVIM